MKDLFIPYYINPDGVKNLYQIALNRYTNIDLNAIKNSVTVQFSLPMAELTCGKIVQGNATVTLNRETTNANLDINTKTLMNIYVELESILHKNSAIKSMNKNNITDLSAGDLVELECIIDKSDASLEAFTHAKSLLQYQQLLSKDIDNTNLISWIDQNINNLLNNNLIKLSTKKLFNTDTVGLISLCHSNSLMDLKCFLGREVTVIGEVTSHNTAESFLTLESESVDEVEMLNDILEDEKYQMVKEKLSEHLLKTVEQGNTKFVEIAPLIIYL